MLDYRNRQTTEVKGKRFRQEFECYEMLISKWERGEVGPRGPSLKLLPWPTVRGLTRPSNKAPLSAKFSRA